MIITRKRKRALVVKYILRIALIVKWQIVYINWREWQKNVHLTKISVLGLLQRHREKEQKSLIANCIWLENRLNHEHEREESHLLKLWSFLIRMCSTYKKGMMELRSYWKMLVHQFIGLAVKCNTFGSYDCCGSVLRSKTDVWKKKHQITFLKVAVYWTKKEITVAQL